MTLLNRIREVASAPELPAASVFRSLVTDVLLAAPAFATHRWRFCITGETLEVCVDPEPRAPIGTAGARERIMSCGAALVLLEVAARHRGVTLQVQPRLAGAERLATVQIGGPRETLRDDHALYRTMMRVEKPKHVLFDCGVRRADLDELCRVSLHHGTRFGAVVGDRLALTMNRGRLLPWPVSPDAEQEPVSFQTFGVLSTPGDRPHDWLLAGEAMTAVKLNAARLGVHAVLIACATPLIEAMRPRLRSCLGECGDPQAVLMLGRALRHPPLSLNN